ncbi:hypothetical protein sos41_26760 [Alphaproteobacteria bacterium SO-S41]|nr:hypothetical protein sos41_26760 [Alphaproteobacteria bacterium SO-S41]
MADAFAKWRNRRAATPPAAAPPRPVADYKTLYLNRGWSGLLLLLWTPVVVALIVVMVLHERELNDIPYSTGMRVLAMLLLFASLVCVPLLGPTTRRHWTLWPDAVEIRQRPYVPLLGLYRHRRLAFADIAVARLGELLSGMAMFELQARDGRRFRLLPTTIGSGKAATVDHAGFDRFIDTIRETIRASGLPVPPGEELRTATSGLTGVVILSIVTALFGLLCAVGAFILITEGEPVGMQMIGFGLPFALLFGGFMLNRWRKWRAARST